MRAHSFLTIRVDSRLFLPLLVTLALGACRTGAAKTSATLPAEPGLDACTTTIRGPSGTGTIRAIHEHDAIREVVDLDGDGTPERQRTSKIDGQGRVVEVDTAAADGTLLSRETRTWDGNRLVSRVTDMLGVDGTAGPDGTPDEIVSLSWQGDVLQSESVDQLDASGLLGTDGNPEFVTTWTAENGRRIRGTQVDTRDQAVVRIEELTWDGAHIARQLVDLGGDGEPDVTISNEWRGGRLVKTTVAGTLETSEITYEYCR